jgi:hypothetical protein
VVDDTSERWTRWWRAIQAPLSWALGAGLLIFAAGHQGHDELFIIGAGLVGLPLVAPGSRSD